MSTVSFLPKGFNIEEDDTKPLNCQIIQADPLGPAFVVHVRKMPVVEYRKVFDKLNKGNQTGGFRSNKALNDKVDRDYLKRAVVGISGLTVDNYNAIVRDGNKLVLEKGIDKNTEIQYSEDLIFYLYRNSFPSDFGDMIWETLKNGAEEQEEQNAE